MHRNSPRWFAYVLAALVALSAFAAEKAPVQGAFLVGGVDAGLTHVRARRVPLDDQGMPGFAVLLSARPAEGEITAWRTADPAERGSFVHILFDAKGEVWVAELGHASAKTGRFGVVTELQKVTFEVKGERLSAHVRTAQEESFGDDRYTVDLTFEAPLEGK
jgi:hypothetical protein